MVPVNTRTIAVFPVDLVLFPRQELPLQIFEPRYKQLVEDCMMDNSTFGVCLAGTDKISGWQAPVGVGTIAKIITCQDAGLDGIRLNIQTMGRGRFRILDIIPPCLAMPPDYDPTTLEGHRRFQEACEAAGPGKMYIQANVQMIPEIDQHISESTWASLVDAWKRKATRRASGPVDPRALDQMLHQYYLITDTPTPDYVYSLAALGASSPQDLQPILEADTADDLIGRVHDLMETD